MKAALLTAYGDGDTLEVGDVPEPTAGANEIKVRVAGASLNPIDWKLRSGAYHAFMPLKLPAIMGRDASGEVVALGPGVTTFKIGARVMGRVGAAHAEFVVAPVEAWAEIPATMDLVDAGALPLVLLTGVQLVDEAIQARPGQIVLVTGATGSVGRVAVFALKARGATTYAGVRAKHKADAAKLGADKVVVLDDTGDVSQLLPLDAIADTVGGDTIQKLLSRVKPGGTIGSVVGEPAGAKDRGLVVRAFMAHTDARCLAEFGAAVAAGKLTIPIAKRFPLEQVRDAYTLAEGGAGGKVLLTVHPAR